MEFCRINSSIYSSDSNGPAILVTYFSIAKSQEYRPLPPNLGSSDIFGLKLPEAFTTSCAGQDFWELQSKNIWGPKVGNHCYRPMIPNFESPDVLVLKLSEPFTTSCAGQDFWEFSSENIWGNKVGNHWSLCFKERKQVVIKKRSFSTKLGLNALFREAHLMLISGSFFC